MTTKRVTHVEVTILIVFKQAITIALQYSHKNSHKAQELWFHILIHVGFFFTRFTGHTKKHPQELEITPGVLEYCLNKIFVEIIMEYDAK